MIDLLLTPYQFRFCPARYINEEVVPLSLVRIATALPDWRHQARVNAWLLSEFALTVEYELPASLGGLALYEQSLFERVLGYLGALLHGRAIRHTLCATQLRRVHRAVGEEGHRYCLEQLDVIIGRRPEGWQRPLPDGELAIALQHSGLGFWLFACGSHHDGFARRLILRLAPCSVSADWQLPEEQRSLARMLCLKVARQVSPECTHLLK